MNSEMHDAASDDVGSGLEASDFEPTLSEVEARVMAVMFEKSITTPKYYPMTINSIMQAANQKSSRSPVMSLTEGEVGSALLSLYEKSIVKRDDTSARATKWEQRLRYKYHVQPPVAAVLVASILRGAQTRAELRAHAEPLNGPSDVDGVDTAIENLMERGNPLIVEFDRQPGQKEARLMHRLCGEPEAPPAGAAQRTVASRSAAKEELLQRLDTLEGRVAQLEEKLGGSAPA